MKRNRKEKDGQVGKHWTDIVSFFLTVFSVLIETCSFVKSCDNGDDLAEVNYKLATVEHRPMIRFYNPTLIGMNRNTFGKVSLVWNESFPLTLTPDFVNGI